MEAPFTLGERRYRLFRAPEHVKYLVHPGKFEHADHGITRPAERQLATVSHDFQASNKGTQTA